MQAPEIELKFPVDDVPTLERRLRNAGFVLQTPRTFEANTLYDTPARDLQTRHQLLRLRVYGERFTVTHKRPAPGTDDSHYKTRIETETVVDDHAAMAEVFAQLGYDPVFRYEKYRSEWLDPAAGHHLVIDETPIGTWAELEGPTHWIDSTAARLAVDPTTTTTLSYGKLFTQWRAATGSPAEHLTFAACSPAVAAAR